MSTEQDPSNPAGNQPPKKPKLKLKLKSKGGAKGANKPSLKLGKKASGEKLALNPQSNTGDTNPPPAGVTQPPMSNPVSIPPADVPPVPETDIAPTAELPPAPVPLGESPPQADLPPLPEVPAVGEEETLSVPPPLSPSPVAAEEEAATALPESNQKLPTLKDVSDDLKEEDKADVFTPSSTETSEADDTVDEDENATEDDEEEELCEISKLKVNIMVLKNKLKTLENQISCSQDDNQGNQSTSDLHDQFNELSANYSRFKEECREELDSLLNRVNQHDNILDTLSPKDQKIEELKAQLESAENKREENKIVR